MWGLENRAQVIQFQKIKLNFKDIDQVIEDKLQMTISEILKKRRKIFEIFEEKVFKIKKKKQ